MQETSAPILVMATANNISQLPPEFLRAGRFDALFFVDLPTTDERREIVAIMNRKYGSAIPDDAAIMALEGFTGAEIEQIAKDSLFDGLGDAMKNIVPLSKTMREDVNVLREWAKTRARPANTLEPATQELRRIRTA